MGKVGISELLVLFIGVLFYFLPAFIASNRRAADRTGIFLLNFFLGWTGLGWIGSLIWAIAGRKEFDPMLFYAVPSTPNSVQSPEPVQDSFGKRIENIQKLKELLDSGAITQEEFDNQKSKLL